MEQSYLQSKEKINNNKREIAQQIRNSVGFGTLFVFILMVLFLLWAILAPLDSASVIEGNIILSNYKKTLQHYEGGMIEKILIKDGDYVSKGQILIILNRVKISSELQKILWQLRYGYIIDKRLQESSKFIHSIQKGQKNIHKVNLYFKNQYMNYSNSKVKILISKQENLYFVFKNLILDRLKIFNIHLHQINIEIELLEKKISFDSENYKILEHEYQKKEELFKKKLEMDQNVTKVKLDVQSYKNIILENKIKIIKMTYYINEIKYLIYNFLNEKNMVILDEYKKNYIELLILESQYSNTQDIYEKAILRAPKSGIINDLKLNTNNINMSPHSKILDIIPQDDNLIIESFISSHDINNIQPGEKIKISFNSYKYKLIPRMEGKIMYVSTDKFEKEYYKLNTLTFYKIKIMIDTNNIKQINTIMRLYPGMSVTIFLTKGAKSFAQYLYSPIKESLHKAFKEL